MSNTLQARQRQLLNYLQGKDGNSSDKIADHVVEQGNIDRHTRLSIYKNAYQVRLKEVIETDHEILGIYLGDDLFDPMAAAYLVAHPSRHRSLRQYADSLPEFLANEYLPFQPYPAIGELARFERLLLSAFDAAESIRMTREDLLLVPLESWPDMRFRFHPSFQLLLSEWNVVEIWQALKANKPPPEPLNQMRYWSLWRNTERLTEFCSILLVEYKLLQQTLAGDSFAMLCETLLAFHDEEEASQVAVNYLLGWIDRGLLLVNRAS